MKDENNGPAVYVGSSRNPGFDQNTVWDSAYVNGIRDLIGTREVEFAKIWAQARDWDSDDKGKQ